MFHSKAIIYEKYGKPLYIDEITIDDPESDQIFVKMTASGICGSQLINLNNPRSQNPELLGHEGTGVALKVGSNVKHVEEGDSVIISWLPYGADENTEYLQWNESVKWKNKKIKSLLFTWAEHSILHKQFVSKLPSFIDPYVTSIIGCAGISGYGTVYNLVSIQPDESVAVFGVGGLGSLALNAAKNLKSNPIIAIDVDDEKLEFAKIFGATHTINTNKTDVISKIHEITEVGVDCVFDMVGKAEITEKTILAAKPGILGYRQGGTIVLTGFPEGVSEFNPRSIIMGERIYKGSRGGGCRPEKHFPKFYQDYQNKDLLLNEVVTRRIKMNEINEAIDDLNKGKILGRAIIEINLEKIL